MDEQEEEVIWYKYYDKNGVFKMRKAKPKISEEIKEEIYECFKHGATKKELQLEYDISQPTLRKYIAQIEKKKKAKILTKH